MLQLLTRRRVCQPNMHTGIKALSVPTNPTRIDIIDNGCERGSSGTVGHGQNHTKGTTPLPKC